MPWSVRGDKVLKRGKPWRKAKSAAAAKRMLGILEEWEREQKEKKRSRKTPRSRKGR